MNRRRATKLAAGAIVVVALLLPAAAGATASDPHFTVGSPTPQLPLTTSIGVAREPWADPICPPTEGTRYNDPGVAPKSWVALLPQALIGFGDQEEVAEVTLQAVADAWVQYLVLSGGVNPPGFLSLAVAQAVVKDRAVAALLSQTTWEGIVQRIGNVYKPTTANAVQFLAHLDQYATGVESAACDGNDGYRLFRSKGSSLLWQLGPTGDWAKLVYDAGAPVPPAGAQWAPVPGAPRTYVATVPTANPLDRFGIPLVRVTGSLTISPDANVHSCGTDESTTATVRSQLNAEVYNSIQFYASWLSLIPQARFLGLLPSFSESCATASAVYTPWTSGPVVAQGSFGISDDARHIAGYTATSTAATISRWHRSGTTWDAGTAFARPTFNFGGSDVLPRLAISGDGETIAGCWLSGPVAGSGFESLQATQQAGLPPHYPEIFNFRNGAVSYPATGTTDPQACSSVSLNGSGDTVWYQQRDRAPNWFSSPTAKEGTPPALTLPQGLDVEATGPDGAPVSYVAQAQDSAGPRTVTCAPASGSRFPLGPSSVSCSATNDFGTSTGSFQVRVHDTVAPDLSLPSGPVIVEATGPGGAVAQFAASANDVVSGQLPASCSPSTGATFPLGKTTVVCAARDAAGNESKGSFEVQVRDTILPTISVSHLADGQNGWNVSSPVIEIVRASDGGSGLSSAPVCSVDGAMRPLVAAGGDGWTLSVAAEGTHSVSCLAVDAVGNEAVAGDGPKLDTLAPDIDLRRPSNGDSYLLGSPRTASFGCVDAVSGLVSCQGTVADGAAIATAVAGSHSFSVRATDNAGNSKEAAASYAVVYETSGFSGAVDNMPIVNTGRAGRTYPLKWQLKDASGRYVGALGAVASLSFKAASCGDLSATTDALETESTGGTSLRYDTAANQYVYNWSTPGKGCYVLAVKLNSGQVLTAGFKLS